MKRARPQGLGASKAKDAMPEAHATDETLLTAADKSFCTLPEDATALEQVKALFDAALMAFSDPENRQKALPLFNGVVHECLRLEQIREAHDGSNEDLSGSEDPNDLDSAQHVLENAARIFTAELYFVLGDSLSHIAMLELGVSEQEDDDSEAEEKRAKVEDASQLEDAKEDLVARVRELLKVSQANLQKALLMPVVEDLQEVLPSTAATVATQLFLLADATEDADSFIASEPLLIADTAVDFAEMLVQAAEAERIDVPDFLPVAIKRLEGRIEACAAAVHALTVARIDSVLRLAILSECDLEEAELASCNKELACVAEACDVDVDLKKQVLLLRGSIMELLADETAAQEFYSQAEAL